MPGDCVLPKAMKLHGILPLLLVVVLVLFPHPADAWSSRASKTYYKVKHAEGMVEEYRQNSGKLSDGQNRWDSIRKHTQLVFPEQPDPFLDNWKQDLVYRAPGLHGEFDVYSIGADGIDNQGGKDDISNWNGVNEGYYWKGSWPLGRFTIIASSVLGIFIFCAMSKIPRHLGRPIAGLVITAGVTSGSFCLLHPGIIPSRNVPLSLIITASGFLSLVFLIRALRNFRYFSL
ncbi:MAG: type II secretion system protein GspG [Verrucomicrobiota bacterium]